MERWRTKEQIKGKLSIKRGEYQVWSHFFLGGGGGRTKREEEERIREEEEEEKEEEEEEGAKKGMESMELV